MLKASYDRINHWDIYYDTFTFIRLVNFFYIRLTLGVDEERLVTGKTVVNAIFRPR